MLQARPLAAATSSHVYRERLLRLLPDSPGHVVWLHAPLGYGKSILAAQWAESLEIAGWRVIWAAMAGLTVQQTLAAALRLPAAIPWAVIHDELAREPTLLVLEDLSGDEQLEPLLRGQHGALVLLASRTELAEPELLRLQTEERLIELTATDLAFSAEEARQLAGDSDRPVDTHLQETGGWPLLLHVALLTGSRDTSALHVALERSLSQEAWQETLFLSAAGTLADTAASTVTAELVEAGYLQQLHGSVRLHPLLSEHLLKHQAAAVQRALLAARGRLRPLELAAALERAGLQDEIPAVLARVPVRLAAELPAEFLRLTRLSTAAASPALQVRTACAQLVSRPGPETAAQFRAALDHPEVSQEDRFHGLTVGALQMSRVRLHDQAAEALNAAGEAAAGRSPEALLYFDVNRAAVLGNAARFEEALLALDRAAELVGQVDSAEARALEASAQVNAATIGYELTGDAVAAIEALAELAANSSLPVGARAQVLCNLAIHSMYELQAERARAAAEEAFRIGTPFWRLWAEILLVYMDRDLQAFPSLLARARRWEQNATAERVSALWLRTCRLIGDLETPGRITAGLEPGPFVHMELALWHRATGRQAEAERLLELARDGFPNREFRQHWHAARYLILGDETELDTLLTLSTRPASLVRYTHLPLGSLPRDRPELARAWPLAELLESGWEEAIRLRRSEIPSLQLTLLGGFTVKLLGSEVQLTARQQQILTLLALGLNREQIAAEVWPEATAEKTMNNLNVQMHSMRRALEPWGQATFFVDGALTRTDTDLHRLQEALKSADGPKLLELYPGPLVPELDSPVLSAYRTNLHNQVTQELLRSAAGVRPAAALPLLERILELDPLHEEALLQLLQLLVSLGRRNAARLRLDGFRKLLLEETGLEPARELREVLRE